MEELEQQEDHRSTEEIEHLFEMISELAEVISHQDEVEPWLMNKIRQAHELVMSVHGHIMFGVDDHADDVTESVVKKILSR